MIQALVPIAIWATYAFVAAQVWRDDFWKPEHPCWRDPDVRRALDPLGPLAYVAVTSARFLVATFWPVFTVWKFARTTEDRLRGSKLQRPPKPRA
jgi:hypothetical protein